MLRKKSYWPSLNEYEGSFNPSKFYVLLTQTLSTNLLPAGHVRAKRIKEVFHQNVHLIGTQVEL